LRARSSIARSYKRHPLAERAGRDPDALQVCALIPLCVDEDGERARSALRRHLFFPYLSLPYYQKLNARDGRYPGVASVFAFGTRRTLREPRPDRMTAETAPLRFAGTSEGCDQAPHCEESAPRICRPR
jgi:hypothetical protein